MPTRLKMILAIACACLSLLAPAQQKDFTVTAYYAGDTVAIDRYDPQKFTHIIFSFCHLKGNRLSVENRVDTLRIQKLVRLKQRNPALKVLLSLGGWGGCASCSPVFSTADGRREFAASVKGLNDFFGTDGIDLDWEYPAIEGYPGHPYKPEDKQNFTLLVAELRQALGTGNDISFAAGGFQKFLDEAIEWEKVTPLVDRINLMSYDLVHGYSTTTGHHTPLYSTATQKESADNAIQALVRMGVPASKLVIGAAFYARIWEAVPATNDGLYQAGRFKTAVNYKDLGTTYTVANGFTFFWDEEARAPYLYHKEQKLFVTYDDKRSIDEKAKYVRQQGLNGIMFWELSHDLSSGGLLDEINTVRQTK